MWINHVSNHCPVDCDTLVDVELRAWLAGSPVRMNRITASALRWSIDGNGGDILRYRICEAPKAKEAH
jgi:hypothetical protein